MKIVAVCPLFPLPKAVFTLELVLQVRQAEKFNGMWFLPVCAPARLQFGSSHHGQVSLVSVIHRSENKIQILHHAYRPGPK